MSRLRAAAPNACILDDFLGGEALAGVYSATCLNVHPCLYDAYGMPVVEAAAFGAPTAVKRGGTVGATALLNGPAGSSGAPGCFELALGGSAGGSSASMDAGDAAAAILAVLNDARGLHQVAATARERALAWGEAAAGKVLHDELGRLVRAGTAGV